MMQLLAKLLATRWVFALIKFIAFRTPHGHIQSSEGDLYMGRWWFIKPRKWLPFSVRLHHICRADNDRHLHDHPFAYRTFILDGNYYEITEANRLNVLAKGMTAYSPLGRWHRISAVSLGGVWTLFVMGRNNHDWAFLVDGQRVDRKVYGA